MSHLVHDPKGNKVFVNEEEILHSILKFQLRSTGYVVRSDFLAQWKLFLYDFYRNFTVWQNFRCRQDNNIGNII